MKYREGIWAKVPFELMLDEDLTKADIVVYSIIANAQGRNLNTWISQEEVAKASGQAVETVSRSIKRLKSKGWIDSYRRGLGQTNVYQAMIDAHLPLDQAKKDPGLDQEVKSRKPEVIIENDPNVKSGFDLPVKSGLDQPVKSSIYIEPDEQEPINTSAPIGTPCKDLSLVAKTPEAQLCEDMYNVQKFANYAIEMKTAKTIIKAVQNLDKENYPEALSKILHKYHELIRSRDKFWAGKPFTPRGLSPHIDRLWALVKVETSNKDWIYES
jgi:hypothetical protein